MLFCTVCIDAFNATAASPQYAQNYAVLNDPSDRTEELYVQGAGHMPLTGLALSMPPLCIAFGQDLLLDVDKYLQTIHQRYLAFFDRHLKN